MIIYTHCRGICVTGLRNYRRHCEVIQLTLIDFKIPWRTVERNQRTQHTHCVGLRLLLIQYTRLNLLLRSMTFFDINAAAKELCVCRTLFYFFFHFTATHRFWVYVMEFGFGGGSGKVIMVYIVRTERTQLNKPAEQTWMNVNHFGHLMII